MSKKSPKEKNCPKCNNDDIYAESGIAHQGNKVIKCDTYECVSCGEIWVWDGKNRWLREKNKK